MTSIIGIMNRRLLPMTNGEIISHYHSLLCVDTLNFTFDYINNANPGEKEERKGKKSLVEVNNIAPIYVLCVCVVTEGIFIVSFF